MKHNIYSFFIGMLIVLSQSACVKEPSEQPIVQGQPLLGILKNNYNFSMFYNSILRTKMDKLLEGADLKTLLVPDNNAFATSGISQDSLNRMDTATLGKLVRYHMIYGKIEYKIVPQTIDYPYQTMAGVPVYFSQPIPGPNQNQPTSSGIMHINGVDVTKGDLFGADGVIHVLRKVLYYPAATVQEILKDAKFSYFVQGLKAFGLWDKLGKDGKYTVMAPTNDQFEQYGVDGAQLDPSIFRSRIVSSYILDNQLFFVTDIKDAPFGLNSRPGVITNEFILVVDRYKPGYGVWPFNYAEIQSIIGPPFYGDAYIYGPAAGYEDSDHQAANGVVHGITNLIMRPDSAMVIN